MARGLTANTDVYVPVRRLAPDLEYLTALFKTRVERVVGRSVEVLGPGGTSYTIASSAVLTNLGFLVVRIGDFSITEATVLDPLAKSIVHYCRLLLTDDVVRILEVRSLDEFAKFWRREHANFSHVIFVGHGTKDAMVFAIGGNLAAAKIVSALEPEGEQVGRKVIVSLHCKTGQKPFAKPLSTAKCCDSYIAPFHTVHGAVASQFVQTFLAHSLLQGRSIGVAFRYARKSVPDSVSFRMWQKGKLVPPDAS